MIVYRRKNTQECYIYFLWSKTLGITNQVYGIHDPLADE
jgi:hypothetical protein